jgi:hypothetical protein
MTKHLKLLSITSLILFSSSSVFSQFDFSEFDRLLHKYVKGNSVNYSQLVDEKENLYKFTHMLSEISPRSHPDKFKSKNEQLAYWINAYNAFILRIIIENYPVDSIKDINFIGFTVWLNKNNIGGEEISFKSLEDDIIRGEFKDPRIHFAINCASFSCPPLKNRAFLSAILDKQLDESTKSFINDKNNFKVDEEKNLLYLSSIFDWYDDDYFDWLRENKEIEEPHLLDYIKLYYNGQIKDEWYTLDIEFFDYNWNLNDIP